MIHPDANIMQEKNAVKVQKHARTNNQIPRRVVLGCARNIGSFTFIATRLTLVLRG